MYSYPLSSAQRSIVKTWLSKKDKPLFITGIDGSGKSTLGGQLLKSYHIVNVNSNNLKQSGNIGDYIRDSLLKKNVLMMCSKEPYKALLIDDLQLFVAYDKTGLKNIYNSIKKFTYVHNPIIIISNEVVHKYITQIAKISYNISIRYNSKLYKSIIQKSPNSVSPATPACRNLHSLKINKFGFDNNSDKRYTVSEVMKALLRSKKTISEVFTLCSAEYTVLSLNMLENVPYIVKKDYISALYAMYESICTGDYTESKYIDKGIDIDVLVFYSCVHPYKRICDNISISKRYEPTYNSYIGRSLIQIHNQSLLSNTNVDYLHILCKLHEYDTNGEIDNTLIDAIQVLDSRILEKQMKVYNYYYNKTMTKKQLVSMMKNFNIYSIA